jgi:TonB family protein
MILIPAGEFVMGDDDQEINPRHKVTLPAYYIYKNVVTVAMYEKFCVATARAMPPAPMFDPTWKKRDHPMVNVTWEDAKTYCDWAGVQLPSEAQWEKAARGTDGRKFPWGDAFDQSKLWCSKSTYEDAKGTARVGSFPSGASPFGVLDMAGNVAQWCDDRYVAQQCEDRYVPSENVKVILKVIKGGAWMVNDAYGFRVTSRGGGYLKCSCSFIGFRCAAPIRAIVSRVKFPDFDEISESIRGNPVTWLAPHTLSRPAWDPPDVSFRGRVEVKVTINADGRHTEEITRRTGVAELDTYLKKFFAGWEWEPEKVDGKPVKSTTTVRFHIQ